MIINGDCLEEMSKMEPNSVDFIVTDPPYGVHFMNKHWDGRIPATEIWAEALRVCKPGTMLAAFGGLRTHHHLMIALESGGWKIRDVIMYLYGSGFPKSHNFGRKLNEEWHGYGTALKPAYEPIIICQKPLEGTYIQNAEKWGVAGINVDESRIGTDDTRNTNSYAMTSKGIPGGGFGSGKMSYENKITSGSSCGRWPANVIFDEEAAEILGERARFFYCAKASSKERNRGFEGMELKKKKTPNDYVSPSPGRIASKSGTSMANNHPTVKPIALMKYIIKLLAPPGNPVLLDLFAGSGSTLVAAKDLGIQAIGIEKEKEYCEIAERRIADSQDDGQLKKIWLM